MTLVIQKLSRQSFDGAGVKFWAWSASIFVHLIVLGAFGTVKFSKTQSKDPKPAVAVAKIGRVKRLTGAVPIVPKPKVKKRPISTNRKKLLKQTKKLSTDKIFNTTPILQDFGDWNKVKVSMNDLSLADGVISPKAVEFFGSFTHQRKICYVVDCSGSMQGIFGRVQEKLTESIESLQPDQYFYIIFFGDKKLFEFGEGRHVRATPDTKSAACNFVYSVRPAGRTNAMAALERALQVRDSSGLAASVIYFLTDGFELADRDSRKFAQKVENLLGRFGPETTINTIGFWPQKSDRRILKDIAGKSGGQWIVVNE